MADHLEKLFSLALDNASDEVERETILAIKSGEDTRVTVPELLEEGEENSNEKKQELGKNITELPIPEKIKLALYGNQLARSLLIRDSNRQISLFVLENPRLTENEVVEIARNTNIDEMILRSIATTERWMKSYVMKSAIVSNPKVPIDISIRWVKFLNDRDLRRLSKSRNIPHAITVQCRKILDDKAKRTGN